MCAQVTRNLVDPITFGATNIAKPKSHQSNTVKTDIQHGAGADNLISTTDAVAFGDVVIIGYDDADSYSALRARRNLEDTLTVKDLNANSTTAGRQFAYSTARQIDVGVNEGYARVGEFFSTFIVRAADGQTDPLAVTTFS